MAVVAEVASANTKATSKRGATQLTEGLGNLLTSVAQKRSSPCGAEKGRKAHLEYVPRTMAASRSGQRRKNKRLAHEGTEGRPEDARRRRVGRDQRPVCAALVAFTSTEAFHIVRGAGSGVGLAA